MGAALPLQNIYTLLFQWDRVLRLPTWFLHPNSFSKLDLNPVNPSWLSSLAAEHVPFVSFEISSHTGTYYVSSNPTSVRWNSHNVAVAQQDVYGGVVGGLGQNSDLGVLGLIGPHPPSNLHCIASFNCIVQLHYNWIVQLHCSIVLQMHCWIVL